MLPVIQSKNFFLTFLVLATILQAISCKAETATNDIDESVREERTSGITIRTGTPYHQLNCTTNSSVCNDVCNEPRRSIPYSSTFCDSHSGSCICDCRDVLRKDCEETPFTPCFQDCVSKNPNPDVFLYEGGNCPMRRENETVLYQCACGCSFRDDYDETNDIII